VEWVIDCLNDVVADFRVFYRVDSLKAMNEMSTDEFFALANRLYAYQGAVRLTVDAFEELEQQELELAEQPDRLVDSGGEMASVPVQDSYLQDLLSKEMAHG